MMKENLVHWLTIILILISNKDLKLLNINWRSKILSAVSLPNDRPRIKIKRGNNFISKCPKNIKILIKSSIIFQKIVYRQNNTVFFNEL